MFIGALDRELLSAASPSASSTTASAFYGHGTTTGIGLDFGGRDALKGAYGR